MIKGKIRRLTPKECERLMSWPDDWTRWGRKEHCSSSWHDSPGHQGDCPECRVEISDSQRYKMCGNGVVTAVVREIAKNLL